MARLQIAARVVIANTILFGGLSGAQICWSQESIEFLFTSVEIDKPDERRLLRYRSSPVYEWCELVEFDVGELLKLIDRISSGIVELEKTSVMLHLPKSTSSTFYGMEYQIPDADRMNSPYTWGGRVVNEADYFASFMVSASHRADGHFSTKDGRYKLGPSHWSENYFLCKWDLAYSSEITRID